MGWKELKEDKLHVKELTLLAAQGDASAKSKLEEIDWHVGDDAYVKIDGYWDRLKVCRAHYEFHRDEDEEIR